MSISTLLPLLFSFDGSSEVVFVDFSTMSVMDSSGNIVSEEKSEIIIKEIAMEEESSMPYVPREQIMNVINTERKLATENPHHVFGRS